MKKIFLIFLCSALIFSAVCGLGISASAEETTVNTNNLRGIWVFNDNLTIPSSKVSYTGYIKLIKTNLVLESSTIYFEYITTTVNGYTSSNVYCKLVAPAATVSIYLGKSWDSFWGNTIYFGANDTSSDFFKYVKQNATKIADDIPTHCNGSMCSTTPDENGDNICDECKLPFVFSLRNDTYDYNGYSFAYYFEDTLQNGNPVSVLTYYREDTTVNSGNIIILAQSDDFDSAVMYAFSQPIAVDSSGQLSIASDNTMVTLFVPSYTDDGSPFWRLNGREIWSEGAYIATLSQVHWAADDLTNSSGTVVFNGDENFMIPLWEKVGLVTQGKLPDLSSQILEKVMILTASSVGLIAFGILLYLLATKLRRFLVK